MKHWPMILLLTLAVAPAAENDPTTWLTYGKNSRGWRYSEMRQISPANVAQLVPVWSFQTGVPGKFETTPLVFDRMMFVTGAENHAYGLDLVTGRQIWHYYKPMPRETSVCCGRVNRGFAAKGQTLFKVNLEARLLAMDAKTGTVLWETEVDDIKKG